MIFLSYWFVLFAIVFFAIFSTVPVRHRRLVLLVGCVAFQLHFAGPAGLAPIVILAVVTYFCGFIGGPIAPLVGITAVLIGLLTYKYSLFLATELLGVISNEGGQVAANKLRELLPAAPPLAISFFAFEFVHYLADVRRGSPQIRSPLDFALFGGFWPSLVAGPIKRYQQFIPELAKGVVSVDRVDVINGILRISLGIIKKFTADYLGQMIGFWDTQLATIDHSQRFIFIVALGLRILFDFSGYSDIAIGFARMMGIRLPENFRWPYLATNLVSFWQRWHISLSTWIRDYIYIALGGQRYGIARRILNVMIAFVLCGLWHGAAWNFVLWGIYHGIGLSISVIALNLVNRIRNDVPIGVRYVGLGLGWLLTTSFVMLGWLLFFYPLSRALDILLLCILG